MAVSEFQCTHFSLVISLCFLCLFGLFCLFCLIFRMSLIVLYIMSVQSVLTVLSVSVLPVMSVLPSSVCLSIKSLPAKSQKICHTAHCCCPNPRGNCAPRGRLMLIKKSAIGLLTFEVDLWANQAELVRCPAGNRISLIRQGRLRMRQKRAKPRRNLNLISYYRAYTAARPRSLDAVSLPVSPSD